jgi:hypothetical protein
VHKQSFYLSLPLSAAQINIWQPIFTHTNPFLSQANHCCWCLFSAAVSLWTFPYTPNITTSLIPEICHSLKNKHVS